MWWSWALTLEPLSEGNAWSTSDPISYNAATISKKHLWGPWALTPKPLNQGRAWNFE